jgi:zinc D-Ala-D-Ala carboxypeptidase
MQLTEHFSLEEFTNSTTALKLGITNTPNTDEIECLRQLCIHTWEPLRVDIGVPISMESGFRCELLNNAVGGVPDSQHRRGEAGDGNGQGLSPMDLIRRVVLLKLDFDEAIDEWDVDANTHWLHMSYTTRRPNRHFLQSAIRKNKQTVYHNLVV